MSLSCAAIIIFKKFWSLYTELMRNTLYNILLAFLHTALNINLKEGFPVLN